MITVCYVAGVVSCSGFSILYCFVYFCLICLILSAIVTLICCHLFCDLLRFVVAVAAAVYHFVFVVVCIVFVVRCLIHAPHYHPQLGQHY